MHCYITTDPLTLALLKSEADKLGVTYSEDYQTGQWTFSGDDEAFRAFMDMIQDKWDPAASMDKAENRLVT